MKKAIVTGATGSVGNGLVCELLANDYEVTVLTRRDSHRNNFIPDNDAVHKVFCSLEKLKEASGIIPDKADVFFHLGWSGTTGQGRNDFTLQYRNIGYTEDAVRLAHELGCHTFVGVGSQAECGRVNEKISSKTVCHPESLYGAAKLSACHMSRLLSKQMGMKHVWVRLLTVYGPLDEGGFVVPNIKKLHNGEIPEFTKGEQIWDFLYYKDAGRALRLLGEEGNDGMVYTIGSGEERMLCSYIKDMNYVLAPEVEFRIGALPYNDNQVMYLCADNTEVYRDVDWKPTTDFITGVKKTEQFMISEMKL